MTWYAQFWNHKKRTILLAYTVRLVVKKKEIYFVGIFLHNLILSPKTTETHRTQYSVGSRKIKSITSSKQKQGLVNTSMHERGKDMRESEQPQPKKSKKWAFILPMIWKSNLSTSRRTFTGCLVRLKTETRAASRFHMHFTDSLMLNLSFSNLSFTALSCG